MKRSIWSQTAVCLIAVFLAVGVTAIICCFGLSRAAAETRGLTVVVDAGHGGIDVGVSGGTTGVRESDINLSLSRKLQVQLEDSGLSVVQTRLTQSGLYGTTAPGHKRRDMQKRAEIIRNNNPALVISLHQNSYPAQPSRRGAQVFYNPNSEQSYALACIVQAELNKMKECVKVCSPLAGDYFLLNCTDYPAIIVEGGFLSNPEDEALLQSERYQQRLAATIAQGALIFLSTSVVG